MLILLLSPGSAPGSERMPGSDPLPWPGGNRDCFCTQEYDPVVCDGGAVFANGCVAACAGAKNCAGSSAKPGEPDRPEVAGDCFCTQNYDPVVCDGGAVFANACVAACAGVNNCRPDVRE